ncbi:TPA: hypothetical protein QDA84_000420 [Burkholderia vietnamiensis]|nr:hypothetical protein [Burkholderia vietnamiensis]
MYRIDDATAATSLPTPEAAGTEGYFTEGNPATGTPATKVRGSWLNMIQEELCAILAAAGITRSKTSYNQVNSALQKMYSPVVGAARNLAMNVSAASASATLTADLIVVSTALNGQTFVLPTFNKTINLATAGTGGMDTGTAPVSGFVALYAIYNPTTGASALLATNATGAIAPNVYGGANMPSGYTASALVSVWPTNASGQFSVASQIDRSISFAPLTALTTSTAQASPTSFSVAAYIPRNARTARGSVSLQSSADNANLQSVLSGSSGNAGAFNIATVAIVANSGITAPYPDIPILSAQQMFYTANSGAGTLSFTVLISGYTI